MGELKKLSLMGFRTPVVPRLNITILERHIERAFRTEYPASGSDRTRHRTPEDNYFEEQIPEEFTSVMEQAKSQLLSISARDEALKVDSSLEPLLQKNAAFIQDQLLF